MRTARPPYAIDPRRFGRRFSEAMTAEKNAASFSNDLRLFATAFAGGFLFFSILLI
jgi:hypothetical protein